jgi:hypothetical protein
MGILVLIAEFENDIRRSANRTASIKPRLRA